MSDVSDAGDSPNPGEAKPPQSNPGGTFDSGFITGEVRHQQLSAKVPEQVARGVFSTGAIVIGGASEFVVDFLCRMARPHQVAARVVLPHAVMPQVIAALQHNVQRYQQRFGPIPPLPRPDPAPRPNSIQEIYDDLRLGDDVICGAFANGLMVSHSPSEFCLDFLTNFFPRSAVSCRIYMAAPQLPRLVEGMAHTYQEHMRRLAAARQQRRQQQQPQAPEPQEPPPPPPEEPGGEAAPPESQPHG